MLSCCADQTCCWWLHPALEDRAYFKQETWTWKPEVSWRKVCCQIWRQKSAFVWRQPSEGSKNSADVRGTWIVPWTGFFSPDIMDDSEICRSWSNGYVQVVRWISTNLSYSLDVSCWTNVEPTLHPAPPGSTRLHPDWLWTSRDEQVSSSSKVRATSGQRSLSSSCPPLTSEDLNLVLQIRFLRDSQGLLHCKPG